jgi:hypothetical protein
MINPKLRHCLSAWAGALAVAAAVVLAPAAAQTMGTGAFRNLSAIETTLLRGVTTKAEVRQQLGIPNGSGAGRWYTLGGDEREIWYYEDFELTSISSGEMGMRVDLRQQLLLVMFKGNVVDGYLWYSNVGAPAPQ